VVLAIVSVFVDIPYVTKYALWVAVIGYIILVIGCRVKGPVVPVSFIRSPGEYSEAPRELFFAHGVLAQQTFTRPRTLEAWQCTGCSPRVICELVERNRD
jgi:hypothetical protein